MEAVAGHMVKYQAVLVLGALGPDLGLGVSRDCTTGQLGRGMGPECQASLTLTPTSVYQCIPCMSSSEGQAFCYSPPHLYQLVTTLQYPA